MRFNKLFGFFLIHTGLGLIRLLVLQCIGVFFHLQILCTNVETSVQPKPNHGHRNMFKGNSLIPEHHN